MKRVVIITILALCLLFPSIVVCQDVEPIVHTGPTWRIIPARTIMWIGEELAVAINGTANATISLEVRPLDGNGMPGNSTYSRLLMLDDNGTTTAIIEDRAMEVEGVYVVQVVFDRIVVATQEIQVNYDPQQYDAIQRQKIWDYLNSHVQDWINNSAENDVWEIREIHSLTNAVYALLILVLVVMVAHIPEWINRFAAYKQQDGRGSMGLRLLTKLDDRTLIYGGAVMGGDPPTIPTDPKLTTVDFNEWGLAGKTTGGALEQIHANAKKIGAHTPQKKPVAVKKPGYFERRRNAKNLKKEKKPAKDKKESE